MSKIGGAAACSRPVVLRTFVRTDTTRDRGLAGAGEAHHPGRPGAQPQGHLARPAARLPHRLHGAVRLRQVQPGLRHDLRRGPAALRRVAVGVRPPVPGPDGQARRRLHRGAEPRGLDRPEVHVQEPSLHRRHHHRGLRLPPPPLRARRPSALPGLPQPDRAADAAADRRPDDGARRGHPVPGAGPGDPGPQGRIRRAVPPAADPGLLQGPGQRRDPHARGPAQARQAEEAHHRGRGRPARGQGVEQAPAHRLGRDRAQPRRRAGRLRPGRPAREGPRPRAEVQRADGVPQRPPDRHRRARAAVVLLQQPVRCLPGVQRPRHPHGGRPRAGRPRRAGDPGRGRDPAVEPGPRRRLLPAADERAGGGARLRPQHALGGPPGQGPEVDPRRPLDQGPRGDAQPLRPRARLLGRVRGRPHLHRAPPPRGRVRHQPGAVRGVHARGALPRLPGQPAQAGLDGGDAR